jgi:hypothetical protein
MPLSPSVAKAGTVSASSAARHSKRAFIAVAAAVGATVLVVLQQRLATRNQLKYHF